METQSLPIAVYLKESGGLDSFYESDTVVVLDRDENGWRAMRQFSCSCSPDLGLDGLRAAVRGIIDRLADVRIIAGAQLSGIPFSVFDLAGFSIFGITDLSDETLDGILADISAGDSERRIKEEIIRNASPAETDVPGVYFLDLVMLQTECPEVSSKKAMRAFFDTTPFLELHLICKHLPPWIETDPRFNVAVSQTSTHVAAVITHKRP
ncbi:MAG: Fe-only nitrogenase accessory AnfO family protein [Oscillospiraceae bacterium]